MEFIPQAKSRRGRAHQRPARQRLFNTLPDVASVFKKAQGKRRPVLILGMTAIVIAGRPAFATDKTSATLKTLPAKVSTPHTLERLSGLSPAAPQNNTPTARTARGVLRAGQTADIAAGMSGRLLRMPYKPGHKFKKGGLLAEFDCLRQNAELEALRRAHETLILKHETTRELLAAGAAGGLELKIVHSEMRQAQAQKEAMKAMLKACKIYAPYNGQVIARQASAFESPQAGAPLYTISRTGDLDISIIAPSQWLRWMETGQSFTFEVDETGHELNGKIRRLGAVVDPVSQTIEITGKPIGKTGKALAGMSGVARFNRKILPAQNPSTKTPSAKMTGQ